MLTFHRPQSDRRCKFFSTGFMSLRARNCPVRQDAPLHGSRDFTGFEIQLRPGANDNGNVLGATNNIDSNRSVAYTYDALNRIASASTANTDCSAVPTNSSLTKNWGEKVQIDAWFNLSNRTVTKDLTA